MNEKHAREARILNRLAKKLVKRRDLPVAENGETVFGPYIGYFKLPRTVKRAFMSQPHNKKRILTRYWRGAVAHSLKAHGATPKGDGKRARGKPSHLQTPSRSRRVRSQRLINAIHLSGVDPEIAMKACL